MTLRAVLLAGVCPAFLCVCAMPALAQRASDNALTSADDAFGTTVGDESVGLYSAGTARGFSPTSAGNIRIEGLYFDNAASLSSHLVSGSSVRVGLSAQSYPFPAPTGIADYRLRMPGDKTITSVILAAGPYNGQASFDFDVQTPITEKLGVVFGGGIAHEEYDYGGDAQSYTGSVLARWRPTDDLEIIPYYSRYQRYGAESANQIFGDVEPPRIPRRLFYGQSWADWYYSETNFGALARYTFNDWVLRAGLFRSISDRTQDYLNIFLNTKADGTATHVVVADPPQYTGSYSGEVRLAREFREGNRRHTFQIALRGRAVAKDFNGSDRYTFGLAKLGVPDPQPVPAYTFRERTHDRVKQGTGGITYQGTWLNVGEISVGLQKTSYHRRFAQPTLPLTRVSSSPWLYSGTIAGYITDRLAVYSSYTRGLEESGVAPENAANRGEAAAASLTKQIDAGVRYAITPSLKAVLGVFDERKPYFDTGFGNIFGNVGSLRHRGVEFSVAGPLAEGLSLVFGTVLIQAQVTVDPALQTALGLGRTRVGIIPRTTRLNLQYGPTAWQGFSVDGQVENRSSRVANRLNTLRIDGRTVVDLGARYHFKFWDAPATLRVQMQNVTNQFAWDVQAGNRWQMLEPRRISASVTADF